MPKIPVYNRQVDSSGINAPAIQEQFTPETSGASGELQKSVARFQSNINDVTEKFRQRADDAATTEAYTELLSAKQDMLYNEKSGAYTKRGKDAFGVSEQYGTQFEKLADSIEERLTPRQRATFQAMRQKEGLSLRGDLQRHTLQESERYENETTSKAIDVLKNEAALDPANSAQAIALMQGKIQDFAEKTGKPIEWTIDRLQNDTSEAHSGVVSSLLSNKQYGLAKKYYSDNKDGVLPKDRERIQGALETADVRDFGEYKAAQLADKGVSLAGLQDELDKISDVKKRDETKRRFLDRMELEKAASREAHQAMYDNAFKSAMEKGTTDAINPGVWNALSREEKKVIIQELNGEPPESDFGVKLMIADLAASDPKKFMEKDPKLWFPSLDAEDRKWLMNLRKAGGKSPALDDFRTESSIMSNTLKEAGLDNMSDKQRNAFYNTLASAQQSEQLKLGRKLNSDEFQALVDKQTLKVSTGIFSSKRAFELTPGEAYDVPAKNIPDRVKNEIKARLAQRYPGKSFSDDDIVKIYLKANQ